MNRAQRRKCKNTYEMAIRIENNANKKYEIFYENKYHEDLDRAIEIFIIAIKYTLHFNEKTRFGNERIKDFMEDLLSTVDMFRTGEYNPNEYKEILLKEGIQIDTGKKKGSE